MLWITVTSPSFFDGEASFIGRLLSCGVDIVHLRKPGAAESDCARLLDELTAEERKRIVIHDFFELAGPYGLRGIHLNARRSEIPAGYTGHVSRSCHSLEEIERWKPVCNYVFLSPIFDSISKQGSVPDSLRKFFAGLPGKASSTKKSLPSEESLRTSCNFCTPSDSEGRRCLDMSTDWPDCRRENRLKPWARYG